MVSALSRSSIAVAANIGGPAIGGGGRGGVTSFAGRFVPGGRGGGVWQPMLATSAARAHAAPALWKRDPVMAAATIAGERSICSRRDAPPRPFPGGHAIG